LNCYGTNDQNILAKKQLVVVQYKGLNDGGITNEPRNQMLDTT